MGRAAETQRLDLLSQEARTRPFPQLNCDALDRQHTTRLWAAGGELRADGGHLLVELSELRLRQPRGAKTRRLTFQQEPEGPDLVQFLFVDRRKHEAAVRLH